MPPTPEHPQPTVLIFSLEIPGKLPSWNEVLGMHHWKRKKLKDEIAMNFLSALQVCGNDSSTRTTCARNTMLTYAATLESYLATKREKQKSRQRNSRLEKAKKKKS